MEYISGEYELVDSKCAQILNLIANATTLLNSIYIYIKEFIKKLILNVDELLQEKKAKKEIEISNENIKGFYEELKKVDHQHEEVLINLLQEYRINIREYKNIDEFITNIY